MIRRPPRSTLFPTRRSSDLHRHHLATLAAGLALLREPDDCGVIVRAHGADRRLRQAHDLGCGVALRSEEHTSELQSRLHLVCRLLLEKKKKDTDIYDGELMK